jgi:hypothetical protein
MIEETKSRMRAALAAADSGPAVSSSVPEVKGKCVPDFVFCAKI